MREHIGGEERVDEAVKLVKRRVQANDHGVILIHNHGDRSDHRSALRALVDGHLEAATMTTGLKARGTWDISGFRPQGLVHVGQ